MNRESEKHVSDMKQHVVLMGKIESLDTMINFENFSGKIRNTKL